MLRTQVVKSKQRVAAHGEVFTPPALVEAMLGLVKQEVKRIDSRVLEPACGSGNFVVPVLQRKLDAVEARYGRSDFERRHQALLALMSIYGIELLGDNVAECRQNLVEVFADYLQVKSTDDWYLAATSVLRANIVHGDALSMTTRRENPPAAITFPEWAYLGKGTYRRRDFRFATLMQISSLATDSLFTEPSTHEIFTPIRDFGSLSVADIAAGGRRR